MDVNNRGLIRPSPSKSEIWKATFTNRLSGVVADSFECRISHVKMLQMSWTDILSRIDDVIEQSSENLLDVNNNRIFYFLLWGKAHGIAVISVEVHLCHHPLDIRIRRGLRARECAHDFCKLGQRDLLVSVGVELLEIFSSSVTAISIYIVCF